MAKYSLCCADCGHETPENDYYIACPECQGFLEVKLDKIPDQLIDRTFSSIFKYHPLMPYDPVNNDITQFEDYEDTPVIFSEPISEALGIEFYFKDETVMPSGTWKDREGFVSLNRLMLSGVKDLFVFSSGNTGTSLARSATIMRGPRLHLVIPNASKKRLGTYKQFFDPEFVKIHYFEGSNDECITEALRLSKEQGVLTEGGFTNYARREGLKLMALEIELNWDGEIDWYVQAVAGGIGVYSYLKAYRDMGMPEKCPRIMGVQADICAPMVNAWKADAETLEDKYIPQEVIPSDFVRVLRTRSPKDSYPILKKVMDKVDGRFESVTEKEIYEGLRLFYTDPYYKNALAEEKRLVGLEPATALAGIVKAVREGSIKKGEKVMLNVSGGAKEGDVRMEWIADLL